MKIRQFLLFLPVVTLLSCTKSLDIDDGGGVEVSIRSISISGPYPQKGTCVLFTEPDGWAYPEFPEGHGITMKYYSPNRNCQMTITMLISEYDKLPNSVK